MSADFFIRMAIGYRGAKALMVAARHGVFELTTTPRRSNEVASTLSWNPSATAQLLGALAALGVLAEEDGTFCNTELAATHLVRARPEYIGNALHFADLLWEAWSHLEDSLRTGAPHKPLPELLLAEDRAFTDNYIRGMNGLAREPAREIAQLVDPGRALLDVGAGPGAYSRAMVDAHPHVHATLLDLGPTIEVARSLIGEHPRIRYREASYFEDYGREFDTVLMSHVTHDESPAIVARMFSHAFAALVPGGRILVHDWVVDENGSAPPFAALFSLHVMLYTNGGRVYRRSEYARLLEGAGFADITFTTVSANAPNPTTLISARRP